MGFIVNSKKAHQLVESQIVGVREGIGQFTGILFSQLPSENDALAQMFAVLFAIGGAMWMWYRWEPRAGAPGIYGESPALAAQG